MNHIALANEINNNDEYQKYKNVLMKNHNPKSTTLQQLNNFIMNHISNFEFSTYNYEFNKENMLQKSYNIINILYDLMQLKKGVCIELNYLFYYFLLDMGFNVKLIKCLEPNQHIYYDIFHLALEVIIKNNKYYVDVGFGAYFEEAYLICKDSYVLGKNIMEFQIIDNCKFKIFINNKELLYNVSECQYEDIKKNYILFYSSHKSDYPILNSLFERIYSIEKSKYIFTNNVTNKN